LPNPYRDSRPEVKERDAYPLALIHDLIGGRVAMCFEQLWL
jgi:hypothetical protein